MFIKWSNLTENNKIGFKWQRFAVTHKMYQQQLKNKSLICFRQIWKRNVVPITKCCLCRAVSFVNLSQQKLTEWTESNKQRDQGQILFDHKFTTYVLVFKLSD